MSTESARITVLALTRAIATHDQDLFDKAAAGIDEEVRSMLWVFLVEAISEEFAIFTPADTDGLDAVALMRMRVALSRLPKTNARLGVRVALEPLVRARR